MASAFNLSPSPSALLSSFASKSACAARRHRHPPTILSLPISSAPLVQTARSFSTRTGGESVETVAAKRLTTLPCRWREVSCNAEVASGQGIRGAENEGGGEAATVPDFDIARLEAYTERVRSEVLCVNALLEDEEEEDQVIVFKGFSSSLTRATPDDPSEPALPPTAAILSIDRLRAPYSPSKPQYIQQGISWQEFQPLLQAKGL